MWIQSVTWLFIYFRNFSQLRGSLIMTLSKPVPEQYTRNWFDREDASTKDKYVCEMISQKNNQAEKVIWFDIRNIICFYSQREKDGGGSSVYVYTSEQCVWNWENINKWHNFSRTDCCTWCLFIELGTSVICLLQIHLLSTQTPSA